MPIGIVSDADLAKEISSYNPRPLVVPDSQVIEGTILDIEKPGRKDGDINVPDSLRAIIGEEALLNGRSSAVALANEFGLSPSSASAYANGATSTASYNSPSKSILGHINKSRERAMKRASKTLNMALESITQEKLDYADADKLSGIAKDMSVIIKNLEPKQLETSESKSPQFVIFAPQFKDERSYDVITVSE